MLQYFTLFSFNWDLYTYMIGVLNTVDNSKYATLVESCRQVCTNDLLKDWLVLVLKNCPVNVWVCKIAVNPQKAILRTEKIRK
jgi:hypothetical protein